MFPGSEALVERVLYGIVDGAVLQPHLIELLLQVLIRLAHTLQLHSQRKDLFLQDTALLALLDFFPQLQAQILYFLLQLQVLLLQTIVPQVFLRGQRLFRPFGVGVRLLAAPDQHALDDLLD